MVSSTMRVVASSSVFSAAANQKAITKQKKNPLDHLQLALIEANTQTYTQLLEQCAQQKALSHGKYIHKHIIENGHEDNASLSNLLMSMYIKCNCVEEARSVFDKLENPSYLSWNAMVSAYAQNGHLSKAIKMVSYMELNGFKPDKLLLLSLLNVYTHLPEAKNIHHRVITGGFSIDVAVVNGLVRMYTRCGSIEDARSVFEGIPNKNVISWNSMLSAYAQYGETEKGLELYRQMLQIVKPTRDTYMHLLKLVSSEEWLTEAKEMHSKLVEYGYDSEVTLATAVVDMYGKCGSVSDAREVFDRIHKKDVHAWNAMIRAYAKSNPQEAVDLYTQMGMQYVQPDCATFMSVLCACVALGSAVNVKMVHGHVKVFGMEENASVANGLINAYCKCGCVEDARDVFNKMEKRDLGWNSMMMGYVENGEAQDALELYHEMDKEPDELTYVSLLDACKKDGRMNEWWYYWSSMLQNGIVPSERHYQCMLLSSES